MPVVLLPLLPPTPPSPSLLPLGRLEHFGGSEQNSAWGPLQTSLGWVLVDPGQGNPLSLCLLSFWSHFSPNHPCDELIAFEKESRLWGVRIFGFFWVGVKRGSLLR